MNLTRKVNALKRDPSIPNPVIHGRAGKGDKNFQPYVSVHWDPETRRFRVWYNVGVNPIKSLLGYMESEDGIHWIRPHRELDKPDDIAYGVCVLDEGRDFPNPGKRYRLAYYSGELYGMRIAVSADGIQWTPIAPGLQFPDVGDIVYMTRDSSRDCYIAVFRLNAIPADGYVGRAPKGDIRRIVGQSVSKDLVHWSPPRWIIMPGDNDEGITGFYRGEVRVQILGTDGKPLPGFSFTDCRAITGDHLSAPVLWGRALAGLKGKRCR